MRDGSPYPVFTHVSAIPEHFAPQAQHRGWAPSGRPGDDAPSVRTVFGFRSGSLIVECTEWLEQGLRHVPGLPPCDRWTAMLGITVLGVPMLLLGSMAVA
jgi:hypothetical protein